MVTRYSLPNHEISSELQICNSFWIYPPLWTSLLVSMHDDIENTSVPNFKWKFEDLENTKVDCVNTAIFNLGQIKRRAVFLGTRYIVSNCLYRVWKMPHFADIQAPDFLTGCMQSGHMEKSRKNKKCSGEGKVKEIQFYFQSI